MESSFPSKRLMQREFLRNLIENIFKEDTRIRFVAVYEDQYMLAGEMRPGVVSFDPDDVAREVDLQLARMGSIARAWERWFGRINAIILRYDKVNLMFRPLGERKFLVVSTEPELDPLSLLTKLPHAIDRQTVKFSG